MESAAGRLRRLEVRGKRASQVLEAVLLGNQAQEPRPEEGKQEQEKEREFPSEGGPALAQQLRSTGGAGSPTHSLNHEHNSLSQ